MRILLVTHHYTPEWSAPQQRWDSLVARFVGAGHKAAVLAPPPHYPSGRAGHLPARLRPGAVAFGRYGEVVHRLTYREHGVDLSSRSWDQLTTAVDAVRVGVGRFTGRHRPDVVVCTAPALPAIPAGLALSALLKVPVVVEVRDAWPDLMSVRREWDTTVHSRRARLPAVAAAGGLLPAAVTALQRRADAVVTTTESLGAVMRLRGMRNVRVIRNGSHTAEPSQHPAPRPAGELRVLYLGTAGRAQGLTTAVVAAARARDAGVPVRLRIVGEGADVPTLTALARTLDAPVDLLPAVPPGATSTHFAWADTTLVSLRAWEPLRWSVPSKLYELLAMGRHISGVLDGEAADIVRATGAGAVVAPGDSDALARLWTRLHADRGLLAVGDGGRRWVAEHADDDKLARDYLDLLAEVARA